MKWKEIQSLDYTSNSIPRPATERKYSTFHYSITHLYDVVSKRKDRFNLSTKKETKMAYFIRQQRTSSRNTNPSGEPLPNVAETYQAQPPVYLPTAPILPRQLLVIFPQAPPTKWRYHLHLSSEHSTQHHQENFYI